MAWHTPHFWYGKAGWTARLLAPAARVYAWGRRYHVSKYTPQTPPVPTICIGNLVAGGSGKTPAARAIMGIVHELGIAANPHFLSRGYGQDENRLLAQDAPTITAIDRLQGLQDAKARNADLVIMDDGFQNPHLRAQLNILVIDGASGFGNGCLIPAGPLREPVAAGLARADAFIIVGADVHNVRAVLPADKPVLTAHIEPHSDHIDHDVPYVAFAGIGRPKKFHDTLRSIGLDVVTFIPFPDHHKYKQQDIDQLLTLGRGLGAHLITTEKDSMKLPPHFTPEILRISMFFDDPDALADLVRGICR